MYKTSKGFTVVEMAIAIVVIGIVVSVVIGASEIVEQSKLKKIYLQATEFKTALHAFEEKYEGLPGDLTNASEIWPDCDPTPSNCNGNGNGFVSTSEGEVGRAFQQLSVSGFIAGEYTGINPYWDPGVNTPAGPFDKSYYKIETNSSKIEVEFNNVDRPNCDWCSSLTPEQAYNIDKLYDDGFPYTGDIWGPDGQLDSNCVIYTTRSVYNVSENSLQCRMKFFFKRG